MTQKSIPGRRTGKGSLDAMVFGSGLPSMLRGLSLYSKLIHHNSRVPMVSKVESPKK